MPVRMRTASTALSVIGLAIALYLTVYHYFGIPLVCSTTGIINCENVLSSNLAYLLGIPIAVYGVIFFALELLLIYFGDKEMMLVYNAVGIGGVAYFIYTEYVIGSICLYCTAVHLIVISLFIMGLYEIMHKK